MTPIYVVVQMPRPRTVRFGSRHEHEGTAWATFRAAAMPCLLMRLTSGLRLARDLPELSVLSARGVTIGAWEDSYEFAAAVWAAVRAH